MGNTVMVIDDDKAIRESISEILKLKGYNVVPCSNGKEGINFLRKSAPCLILLDLMMPVMNGWEFLEEIESFPDEKKTLCRGA